MNGLTAAPEAAGVLGTNSSTTGFGSGVSGTTAGNGSGVIGTATSTTGTGAGVSGYTDSSANFSQGVYGEASAPTGITWGVQGVSKSAQGIGVQGSGQTIGVSAFNQLCGASGCAPVVGTAGVFSTATGGTILVGAAGPAGVPNVAYTTVFRVDSAGKGFFDGGTQTGGADFAESVTAAAGSNHYEPGDLLVLDPAADRQLTLAGEAYSTMVAGIYSTKPGVLATTHSLESAGVSGEVPLAVVGIVPCKVSAENGPIHRGDLLVTSSKPGFAMKGTDRSRMLGAIVGKAMEPLAGGTGVIQVLVTLQ